MSCKACDVHRTFTPEDADLGDAWVFGVAWALGFPEDAVACGVLDLCPHHREGFDAVSRAVEQSNVARALLLDVELS